MIQSKVHDRQGSELDAVLKEIEEVWAIDNTLLV